MSNKLPISVHVLTFNSAETLERALLTVQNCREILIIDGGSTDGTIEVAENYGAKIIPQGSEQGKPISNFSNSI